MPLEYNLKLQHWDKRIPNKFAGKGNIEVPGKFENIVWQTRDRIPSNFELMLVHELQEAYENDAHTPDDLVAHLNRVGLLDSNGQAWNVDSFKQYINKMGY